MADRRLNTLAAPTSTSDGSSQNHRLAGHGCAEAVRRAAAAAWSGVLELSAGNHLVAGTVVFDEGRLAWATSMRQQETLGSFLFRLGHVTRDDLDIVEALFQEKNGESKLGRLLEESGILPRQILRRCLLLHVRLALSSLLGQEAEVVNARPGSFCVEEELVFTLEDVLPEWSSTTPLSTLSDGPAEAITAVLETLKTIPGHRASLVADRRGTPLCARGLSPSDVPGPSMLATTALTLLESSTHAATWNSLGSVDFASSEGTDGSLLAQWLDEERSLLAAVLLAPTGKVGVARHGLGNATASFAKHLAATARNGS